MGLQVTPVKSSLPVWGFPAEELESFPDWIAPLPVEVEHLPVEPVLLVYDLAEDGYVQAENSRRAAGGSPQQAILYLTREIVPSGAWRYYAGSVMAGDWEKLKELLACPCHAESADFARLLPARRIDEVLSLARSAQDAPGSLDMLPLPATEGDWAQIESQIAANVACRRVFVETLQERQAWRWRTHHPSGSRLATYVSNKAGSQSSTYRSSQDIDHWVEAHLPICPICSAKVKALGKVVGDE